MIKGAITATEAIPISISGIAIVFIVLLALWGMVVVISRVIGAIVKPAAEEQKSAAPAAAPVAAAPVVSAPEQPIAAATELIGIDETSAACVMAIVSHETGIPLEELTFRSIKAV